MCQEGAINIAQKGFGGDNECIRFHKSDIPRLIKALQEKIPEMTSDNCDEFNENLMKMDID